MYYIGIDLGGTNIGGGIVDGQGRILIKDEIPTLRHRLFEEVIEDMAGMIKGMISRSNININRIKAIGIGSPGASDNIKGTLVFANNFGWRNVPIRKELMKHIDLPVYINNDATVAALAESTCGAGKNVRNSVTITLGTGIGSGIIIDNRVYSGSHGVGGELGHITMDINGPYCTCGNRGCWEQFASATALTKAGQVAAKENPDTEMLKMVDRIEDINPKIIEKAAIKNDRTAVEVFERYIFYLSMGIINIINSFDPEMVIIGGGVSRAGDFLLEPLKRKVGEHVFYKELPYCDICLAQMGNDAGIVGAALFGKSCE